jgi:1-acyl-sn-glycerol-3-phosphate acyltransferase
MIRTFLVALFLVPFIVVVGVPLILYSALAGTVDTLYWTAVWGLRVTLRLGGIRVRAEGLDNIPPGVCIFATNHVSNVDPVGAVAVIPRRVALLAKKEVFRIPIVASALRVASIVPVDRSDREAAVASVEQAVRHLKQGISFMVFPEGTRSPDGRLRPFKRGTFVMAIEAGVPVVPVSLIGTQKLLPKGSWAIRPGEMIVKFGPPVDASKYTADQRGELLARVESLVAAGLPPEQKPQAQQPKHQQPQEKASGA